VTREARGELVKLVCGDDLLAPECLTAQVAAFDEHGAGVVMVASARDIVDASERPVVRGHGLGGAEDRHLDRATLDALPEHHGPQRRRSRSGDLSQRRPGVQRVLQCH
jgi:hypothetical protein